MKQLLLNYLPNNYAHLSFKDKKTVIILIKKQIITSNNQINTLIN